MNTLQSKPVNPVLLWSKRKLWTVRVILLVIVVGWVGLWFYLHHQVRVARAKVEQNRIEASRRNEFLRREAQYKQDLSNFNQGVRSRNVFEGR